MAENCIKSHQNVASSSSVTSSNLDDKELEKESSVDETSSSGGGSSPVKRLKGISQQDHFGQTETQRLWKIKGAFIFILLGCCISLSAWIFQFISRTEKENFQVDFSDRAQNIFETFQINFEQDISAVDSLGIHITSNAKHNHSATWPFATLPDFDVRAASAAQLTKGASLLLGFCPLVIEEHRKPYEEYAIQSQWWIHQVLDRSIPTEAARPESRRTLQGNENMTSIEGQEESHSNIDLSTNGTGTSEHLFLSPTNPSPNGTNTSELLFLSPIIYPVPDLNNSNPGPYLPIWQSDPYLPQFINYDILSSEAFNVFITLAFEKQQAVLSDFYTSPDFIRTITASRTNFEYKGEPTSLLYYPIFDDFTANRKNVGLFFQILFWPIFFENILPSSDNGYIVILENGCDKQFTFEINGPGVVFLGEGDLHNERYDEFVETFDFKYILSGNLGQESSITNIPFYDDVCPYSLRAYPSEYLEDQYITNTPIIVAICCCGMFIFTTAIFLVYDCLVEKRQNVVMHTAIASNAIVSSIFPEVVRDRLYQSVDKNKADPEKQEMLQRKSNDTSADTLNTRMHPKRALKMQLNWGVASKEAEESMATGALSKGFDLAKPIADLFTDCTVFFADISGFTAWSSQREPDQVFLLLQNVYQSFDEIARKLRVFKVETIGDCYLAVTGLPEAQPDHAVRMTRFARLAVQKMKEVTRALEVILGPETGELCMRIGMHSGPVIAGVLRGEKSRFQLFGDTVNTASRMESTGKANCIQVSQATADILVESGKKSWITPREDFVHAKGKGKIQTYWVGTSLSSRSTTDTTSSESDDSKNSDVMKQERLVDWQVDLLSQYLKVIIASRHGQSSSDGASSSVLVPSDILTRSEKGVIGEVSEAIELPGFQQRSNEKGMDPSEVELDPIVVSQLRSFTQTIAAAYHDDNPFHNFEHASHVTLCAIKFLKRIATPEEVDLADAANVHKYTYGITSDAITQFTVILAALIHDTGHRGVPNFILAKEDPKLATKYHNQSIAEQNSVDIAWDILMDPSYEELQKCIYANESELKRFRQLLVNAVMATDIFDPEMKTWRDKRWGKAFSESAPGENDKSDLKAAIVIEHIIQAADVAHTMQHWHIYQKWNQRLFDEMYSAYLSGRSTKDPSEGWYSGEIWFFDNYVIPLAKKLSDCKVFGVSSDECLNYALSNRKEWETKGRSLVKNMLAKHRQMSSK